MVPKPSWYVFLCGLIGGAADAVPGVSGGTVYFVLRIYQDLLFSISTFTPKNILLRRCAWKYLLVLGLGVICSFLTLAHVIVALLHSMPGRQLLFALFFGLVSGSFLFCYRQIKQRSWPIFGLFCIGLIVAFFVCQPEIVPREGFSVQLEGVKLSQAYNYDPATSTLSHLSFEEAHFLKNHELMSFSLFGPWPFFCGVLAVSAMLLPGISGSYVLTVLGMYGPILTSLLELVHGQFSYSAFSLIGSVALGIVFGALLAARLISWAFAKFHDATIAVLCGFMLGSLKAVWPFFTTAYVYNPYKLLAGPRLMAESLIFPELNLMTLITIGCMVFGVIVVLFLENIAQRLQVQSN